MLTEISRSSSLESAAVAEVDFRDSNKFKAGREMAITAAVEAKRDELVQAARFSGENLLRRTFGVRGPDWNVTLVDLEQFWRPLVQALAAEFLAVSASEPTLRLAET